MNRGQTRLLILADHIESNRRGHDKFNFSIYTLKNSCGTAGCALGECPTIWKSWKMINGAPQIGDMDTNDSAAYWFNLPDTAIAHLFYPDSQLVTLYGGCSLEDEASAKEVADNIRAFVAPKVEGEAATDKPKGEG